MAFFDSVKNGFSSAVDTVSSVTQTIIEKNRINAQLNRLRTIMKNECEMINRAYITLGKKYYENKMNNKTDSCTNEEELFKIIEDSKDHIKKARERYRQLIESQTVEIVKQYNIEDLEDITVACSNEDEYEDSPFEASDTAEENNTESNEDTENPNSDDADENTDDIEVAQEDNF